MRGKVTLLIGAAAGYVLGTRAGRERYEQIVQATRRYWEDPKVQQKVGEVEEMASETAKTRGHHLQDKVGSAARDLVHSAQEKVSSARGGGHGKPAIDLPAYETARTQVHGTTAQAGSNGRLD